MDYYIKNVAANAHHCGKWKPLELNFCLWPGLAPVAVLCLHPSLVNVSLERSEAMWSWLVSVTLTGRTERPYSPQLCLEYSPSTPRKLKTFR